MRAPITSSSARAFSIDAPGARRPKTETAGPVRGASVDPFTRSGIQIRWLSGKPKPSGITPTIVAVAVPSFTVRPSTAGSFAKRVSHSAWPMTTTGGSAGRSSWSVSARPSSGAVPISLNALAVISAPRTASTRPSSVARLRTKAIAAPMWSTVLSCSRQIAKSCRDRKSGSNSFAFQLRMETTRSASRIGRRGFLNLLTASK